ncbi:N-formylglutamate amidohydrolase [Alisedimentitalea sp. MJ-SS2]|uniref:N-formylglutamate amidohydrolase n=1 Tax=Aliisedimentitalea sp. MJ-SS2 TaxID=3049795 RepID=UPI0029141B9E|nr:N-formylglutamate amidohydrolase [Alisedimentitalea sp. MJ-SS2]MDU8927583.1 N-formylglutamate amidohydrolase [Alisedimentitalea sp. MJ-SS2]
MPKVAYDLIHPEKRTTSVVFASPHSGRDYPWSFLRRTQLDRQTIRSSEDAYVDQLFDSAPDHGAPFLRAGAPRAFVDLNRGPDELDPALIEGVARQGHNPRISSGLGVIPRVVAGGREIYSGKLPLSEAKRRIAQYWRPYHAMLERQVNEAHALFGEAILVDCHSMPHEAMDIVAKGVKKRPEVVIGDRFGAAASSEVVEKIEASFAAAGLTVVRNAPFAGAYVVQTYGRPSKGRHAVQVEVDRSLYMNEALVRPNGNFNSFRRLMRQVTAEIAEIGCQGEARLAAE